MAKQLTVIQKTVMRCLHDGGLVKVTPTGRIAVRDERGVKLTHAGLGTMNNLVDRGLVKKVDDQWVLDNLPPGSLAAYDKPKPAALQLRSDNEAADESYRQLAREAVDKVTTRELVKFQEMVDQHFRDGDGLTALDLLQVHLQAYLFVTDRKPLFQ